MDRPPNTQYRPRKLAAICTAAVAAALFTPVPATADVIDVIERPRDRAIAGTVITPALPKPDTLALSLISTGMIGIGLSMGGLAIVAHRRRQW